jgi:hypothetical protein
MLQAEAISGVFHHPFLVRDRHPDQAQRIPNSDIATNMLF